MRLGFIGYGTIAAQALDALSQAGSPAMESLVILARADGQDRARGLGRGVAAPVTVVDTVEAFIAARPQLAVELAGHEAVAAFGPAVLRAGIELIVTSVGALADAPLHEALEAAAREGHARMTLVAGAVGGLDILGAVRLAGLDDVLYTSRKPPDAWRGSAAEAAVDLGSLTAEAILFEGSAREAALAYPKNANVAATIALAGDGFDRTRVRLIADPGVTCNTHEIVVESAAARVTIRIEGRPSPRNPRTSVTVGCSVAQTILAHFGRSVPTPQRQR